MGCPIEHGSDEVVKPGIHPGKYRGGSLFYHVDSGEEIACLTYQEFSRFKGQGKVLPVFPAKIIEAPSQFLAQLFHIGLYISLPVGDFETTAEIDELQVFEVQGR